MGELGELLPHSTTPNLATRQKLWKAFNKPGGARANFLSALGSVVSSLGSADLAARAARAQQLSVDLAASDLAQSKAYQQLQRVQTRRFMAEDAIAAINAAKPIYNACIAEHCGVSTMPPPRVPDFIDVSPDGKISIESWGRALTYFNEKMRKLIDRLQGEE